MWCVCAYKSFIHLCVCVCVCVCVCIHTMEYNSVIAKSEITPSAGTWMDLEMLILTEVRKRKIVYDITYMWSLKYDTNESIYK